MVFDADSLWSLFYCYKTSSESIKQDIISTIKSLCKKNSIILTPNVIESVRMLNSINPEIKIFTTDLMNLGVEVYKKIEEKDQMISNLQINDLPKVSTLMQDLVQIQNLYVILKGNADIVFTKDKIYGVKNESSKKRCGGQGDILSGLIAVYSFWANNMKGDQIYKGILLASFMTRLASKKAFKKYKRSLTALHIIKELEIIIPEIFD